MIQHMLSRRTILICLASGLIASFKSHPKDYLQTFLNVVPKYDTCAPPNGPIPSSKPGDAPFSQGQKSYESAIHCPRGIRDMPRGIVLMVPCTSANGAEVFSKLTLSLHISAYGLGDMQIAGEFVAYAVSNLASSSPSGKINVVTHSQGGVNAQWAITFWPSIRNQITNLVTIGAPHRGAIMIDYIGNLMDVIGGSLTYILQMRQNSRYMSAVFNRTAENGGLEALVPTTSLFTFFDQFVLPQASNSNGSSYLSGASNIAIQEACGRNRIIEHFGIILDMATYGLVYDALSHGRPASLETFDRTYCEGHFSNHFLHVQPYVCLTGYGKRQGQDKQHPWGRK
ncbi:uncharacterized protein MELLADRAFT_111786 [Melampsora larici-populina 98AG31]|uniref:GPI inositol-deacylase n=1 Tax=Melampsora larici-populina (strain 98AG31 / pathotype 3-4-7) TaxID=747676 RepID=F4S483_MELLP|nr:uncharacterized protein MELLADRAFT_111786 [Melampsora larici-populina 98AG31]EGG00538.1 hypothetical protein MELLADRAFT_111786 [Melampsora larici-populina 98AG31]